MAGLGFKDFQVGEVLTSSDVDGYLMQQTVMRFADAAARGSALGTATGTAVPLAEGMVSYLDDLDNVQVYTGVGWKSVIAIQQVVQTALEGTFASSSTSFTDVTGLTASITPTSTSSTILVRAVINHGHSNATFITGFTVADGSNVNLVPADTPSNRSPAFAPASTAGVGMTPAVIEFIHSPATTSAVTYKIRGFTNGGTFYVNRSATDTDNAANVRSVSSITLFEIAP